MKRFLGLLLALAAVGCLARLPHPAVDVGKLEPVELVRLSVTDGKYLVETDTGAAGWGRTLSEAAEDLQNSASGVVFLDTADYLLLTGDVDPTALYEIIRPACRVCYGAGELDLEEAAGYLAIHSPEQTLADLRAGEKICETLTMEGGRGTLAPN